MELANAAPPWPTHPWGIGAPGGYRCDGPGQWTHPNPTYEQNMMAGPTHDPRMYSANNALQNNGHPQQIPENIHRNAPFQANSSQMLQNAPQRPQPAANPPHIFQNAQYIPPNTQPIPKSAPNIRPPFPNSRPLPPSYPNKNPSTQGLRERLQCPPAGPPNVNPFEGYIPPRLGFSTVQPPPTSYQPLQIQTFPKPMASFPNQTAMNNQNQNQIRPSYQAPIPQTLPHPPAPNPPSLLGSSRPGVVASCLARWDHQLWIEQFQEQFGVQLRDQLKEQPHLYSNKITHNAEPGLNLPPVRTYHHWKASQENASAIISSRDTVIDSLSRSDVKKVHDKSDAFTVRLAAVVSTSSPLICRASQYVSLRDVVINTSPTEQTGVKILPSDCANHFMSYHEIGQEVGDEEEEENDLPLDSNGVQAADESLSDGQGTPRNDLSEQSMESKAVHCESAQNNDMQSIDTLKDVQSNEISTSNAEESVTSKIDIIAKADDAKILPENDEMSIRMEHDDIKGSPKDDTEDIDDDRKDVKSVDSDGKDDNMEGDQENVMEENESSNATSENMGKNNITAEMDAKIVPSCWQPWNAQDKPPFSPLKIPPLNDIGPPVTRLFAYDNNSIPTERLDNMYSTELPAMRTYDTGQYGAQHESFGPRPLPPLPVPPPQPPPDCRLSFGDGLFSTPSSLPSLSSCIYSSPSLELRILPPATNTEPMFERPKFNAFNDSQCHSNQWAIPAAHQQQEYHSRKPFEQLQQQHHRRNSRSLNERAVAIMQKWYNVHKHKPYPTPEEKATMAAKGEITVNQVTSWFSNKRNRTGYIHKAKVLQEEKQKSIQAAIKERNHVPDAFLSFATDLSLHEGYMDTSFIRRKVRQLVQEVDRPR